MSPEEYAEARRNARDEYVEKVNDIARKYAEENNPFKHGDIITDHMITIRITGWDLHSGVDHSLPSLRYSGPRLRKSDLKPVKSHERGYVYQNNIESSKKGS
jgi:hypothetical protein